MQEPATSLSVMQPAEILFAGVVEEGGGWEQEGLRL